MEEKSGAPSHSLLSVDGKAAAAAAAAASNRLAASLIEAPSITSLYFLPGEDRPGEERRLAGEMPCEGTTGPGGGDER